jgi:ABC-type multidrug transport system fused ATPase/permease subunit
MIIDKEKKFQLCLLAGLIAVILISFFIGWKFHLIYLLIFLLAVFCVSLLVLTEFYLRIQHNVDNNAKAMSNKLNEISQVAEEIKRAEVSIGDKINGERELYEEVVDFFENLLNYLEENKQEILNLNDKADKRNNETDQKIEELNKIQNKIVVLLQQILEHQEDQTNFLKEETGKLKNEH